MFRDFCQNICFLELSLLHNFFLKFEHSTLSQTFIIAIILSTYHIPYCKVLLLLLLFFSFMEAVYLSGANKCYTIY